MSEPLTPFATSRPNTLAELFASWGPDHTISPHEPRAFNKLASRYSDLLQLVHRLEDAPGSAGRAGSHLDMAKAPGPSPQYNVVEGCAMMPGPFTSPSETAALEVARENGYAAGRASTLVAPMSATRPRTFEDKPLAWLIERPVGTGKQATFEYEVVLSPLTDDTFMDEGDCAYGLFREVYNQDALDQAEREADEMHKRLRIE